jgi:hypothetical protein
MKKVILVSLCVLLGASVPVFGYWVTGQVQDESGNAVSGATVYINCYPQAGGVLSDTRVSGDDGGYAGGWPATNCNGENIVVKAVKGSKSGTVSYLAGGAADVKIVTISTYLHPTAELHCEAQPMAMDDTVTMVPSTCNLYVQATAGPIQVNGGTATMQYDTTAMYCAGVEPMPPFGYSFSYYEPTPGTINVSAFAPPGMYVPVQNGGNPTQFFTLRLTPLSYTTPGKISNVKLTSSEIVTNSGYKSAFPSRTEYVIGEPNAKCKPYFKVDTQTDWQDALSSGHVYAMDSQDWEYYMLQWQNYTVQGMPYPSHTFRQARQPDGDLYVYGGGGGGGGGGGALDPCDAGLVMYWGSPTNGNYSSAWRYDYLRDPDLSNCIISVEVTAPQFSKVTGAQVNRVSFGLENPPIPGGPIRAWYWNCGAAGSGAPIIWNTPTIITIDTSKTGTGAATPIASAYANNPAFNLKNVQWLIVDEDANWVGGGVPAPTPGSGLIGMWNYWHNLSVTPHVSSPKHAKYYTKWSQPPVEIDANHPTVFLGWNEHASYEFRPIIADDWLCKDQRPVTDIHWWGSFIGWNQPTLPAVVPTTFHIGIWTDVPNGADPLHPFSHPGTLVWQNFCDNWVWNFAGYDKDPRQTGEFMDSCFQFNQLLSQDEWFYQDGNEPNGTVYWLSIGAIYQGQTPQYPFGMKTRQHFYNDDAIRFGMMQGSEWPPVIGSQWANGMPIKFPEDPCGVSWDMAFELSTNEPPDFGTQSADLNQDGIVDFFDFAIFANQWLTAGP